MSDYCNSPLGRETVDSVITELISTLLCGVRDSDPDTRILFCTCLGEVGAVDAGLLDSVISTEISKHKVLLFSEYNRCINLIDVIIYFDVN